MQNDLKMAHLKLHLNPIVNRTNRWVVLAALLQKETKGWDKLEIRI